MSVPAWLEDERHTTSSSSDDVANVYNSKPECREKCPRRRDVNRSVVDHLLPTCGKAANRQA
eukprot:1495892-Amphidinium_carterae.1